MIAMLLVYGRFARAIGRGLADPEFRALASAAAVVLVAGTVFYWFVEDWSVLNSLYFCVTTLTTIGFGDPAPTTVAGKIFTIGYAIVGIGAIGSFVYAVAARAGRGKVREAERDAR